MFNPHFHLTGVSDAIAGAELAEQRIKTYVGAEAEWFGSTVAGDAKDDHPYTDRTGVLSDSIGYNVEPWQNNAIVVTIFAMASYSASVEYGTYKSKAYPFLFPKFYRHIHEFMERVRMAVNRALTEGGERAGIKGSHLHHG